MFRFSIFIVFEFSHDTVFKVCRLEFSFKIYSFRNLTAKSVLFSCEREAYPSYFSQVSNCAGVV